MEYAFLAASVVLYGVGATAFLVGAIGLARMLIYDVQRTPYAGSPTPSAVMIGGSVTAILIAHALGSALACPPFP